MIGMAPQFVVQYAADERTRLRGRFGFGPH